MVQEGKSETQTVEVKSAHLGVPKVRDTLSSFSNQDDGGIILFGLDESEDFRAVGVFDVQALQKGITEQCNMIEPTVRAIFSVLEIQKGIYILVAEIPSVPFDKRPAYYIPMGRTGGSFIRVGDADKKNV